MQREDRHLSILLWLGGVPPIISGVLASTVPDWYLKMTGVTEILSPAGKQALAFLFHLQGGDAWVGGSARIAVAVLGSLALKRILAILMIVHSSYELWLLPTHAFSWCADHPGVCTPDYISELWLFILLHAVLVAGSVWVLARARLSARPDG
jgi:hypothetical protein